MIAIIDVTGHNVTFFVNSIHHLGFDCMLTHSHEKIINASHVILPGVGRAVSAMQALHDDDLVKLIQQLHQPLLGICLGMQLLFEYSEEGSVIGLGLLKGTVQRLPKIAGFSLPHIGWNSLHWSHNSLLQKEIDSDSYLYFMHGFAVQPVESTIATCHYGTNFSAIVHKNNVCGMQFHPEKSSMVGLKLLKNFLT